MKIEISRRIIDSVQSFQIIAQVNHARLVLIAMKGT
jgi:hypothetical protein